MTPVRAHGTAGCGVNPRVREALGEGVPDGAAGVAGAVADVPEGEGVAGSVADAWSRWMLKDPRPDTACPSALTKKAEPMDDLVPARRAMMRTWATRRLMRSNSSWVAGGSVATGSGGTTSGAPPSVGEDPVWGGTEGSTGSGGCAGTGACASAARTRKANMQAAQ